MPRAIKISKRNLPKILYVFSWAVGTEDWLGYIWKVSTWNIDKHPLFNLIGIFWQIDWLTIYEFLKNHNHAFIVWSFCFLLSWFFLEILRRIFKLFEIAKTTTNS